MLANLFNSYFASAVLAGPSIDMGQQTGSRMARCLRVGVFPDCSNHPFPIDPTAAPVLFRPAKLPDIRTLLASCLNDTSVLHGLPPACTDGGSLHLQVPEAARIVFLRP